MADPEYDRFDDYQRETSKTIVYPNEEPGEGINYCIHGLTGEAGEVAEKWKKILRDKGGVISEDDRRQIALELGDVLWYLSRISDHLDLAFSFVARENLNKLRDRHYRDKIHGEGDNR